MKQLKITNQITKRDSVAFEKYLADVSKIERITPDEEIELARKIKNGDEKALKKLVSSNLRFVVSVAKQYQNGFLSLQDLVNEGNIGLIKAAKLFDETKGFKFISYAVWWIRQAITYAISSNGRIVRIPLNKLDALRKINNAKQKLSQKLYREPTKEEILELLGSDDYKKVINQLSLTTSYVYIDKQQADTESTNSIYDIIGMKESELPDENLMHQSLRTDINNVLSILNKRDAEILKDFFGINRKIPLTLDEISVKFNLSKERIRQIRLKAIRRLKDSSRKNTLKTYL